MSRKIKNGDKYGEWTVIKAYSSKNPRYKNLVVMDDTKRDYKKQKTEDFLKLVKKTLKIN